MGNIKDQYSERLIMKARAGNNSSFHELSNMLMLKIYPLIFSLVPREEIASKILLKVLLRAKESIHKLEKETHFLVWLKKISVIESFHYLKNSEPISLSRSEVEDFCESYYRNLSNVEKEFLLLSCMERITLAMSDILEISSDQISRIMRNLSEKDVSESIRNTRDKLIRKFPFEEVKDFNENEWKELNQNLLKLDEGSNLDISDSELELLDKYLSYSKSILGGILKHLTPTDRIHFELREELLKISYSSILKEKEKKDRKEEEKIMEDLHPQVNNSQAILSNPNNSYSLHDLFVNHSKKLKRISVILTLSALTYFGYFTLFGSAPSWVIEKSKGIVTINSNLGTNNELNDGDVVSTVSTANLTLKLSNMATLKVFSDSKLKIVNVSSKNNMLELLSGKITFNARKNPDNDIISEDQFQYSIKSANVNIFTTYSKFGFEKKKIGFDLTVFDGWLKVENNGRSVYLPKNYKYAHNFAAPYHINASKEIVNILAKNKLNKLNESDLNKIIRFAEEKDAITLWHLLYQTDGMGREIILSKLNESYPILSLGIREGILKLDVIAMTNLQEFLYYNIDRNGL